MNKAILASIIGLSLNWYFATYLVLIYWAYRGAAFILREAAKGGFFE